MTKLCVQDLKVGDQIMPPAREVRLWMRRDLAARGLPESALYLRITDIREGQPDKGGRWFRITADHAVEWHGGCPPYPSKFSARPETLWIKIEGAE